MAIEPAAISANPAVTTIDVVERETDVIQLISPLLPKDERIHIHHDDFDGFTDREDEKIKRDTIIWDLAVWRSEKERERGAPEMLFVKPILMTKYAYSQLEGQITVQSPNCNPDLQIFVHGLDRDPEGQEFVKTDTFKWAQMVVGH